VNKKNTGIEKMAEERKEVYLDADKEIPGQHYACLSFLSPEKVLANKDVYFFTEFLKDYEVQYKIKATETFLMSQMTKLQEHASKLQDIMASVTGAVEPTKEDLEKAFQSIKDERILISKDISTDLEAHVKANMADFKTTTIQEAYETFLFKNRKRLEDDFFAKNDFRTTVRGLKVRGVYDTYNEATNRAKTIQKLDPAFNVYVGQVGFWLPWDPEPSEVADQEYADDQLNQLMKKYKENETQREEFFEEMKRKRIGDKTPRAEAAPVGAASNTPTAMFEGEDLAIARKRDAISHS
jgi:hypothetical protein